MKNKKEFVAMLLAGGQGSRLYALTNQVAKPAVSYGGKYRIIDFPLSNCINSNIDTVGVLTQYQPLLLNDYIGNGQPWDLDRNFGGVHILPPYQGKKSTEWYKGTANAIYQNLNFIKRYDPKYVLILSGDHIYKMDYEKMLAFHKANNSQVTISVINVTMEEATRFGIMNTKEDGTIYEFEEKPKKPKSTNASMGIYIFDADILYKYLEEDDKNPNSENDFGKNIIPTMLNDGIKMMAYPFKGYWKDVGTIKSLWESNMDLIGDVPNFDIFDDKWKIYSRNEVLPPQYFAKGSLVKNSLVTSGTNIMGSVENSILAHYITIDKGAVVKDSVVFDGAKFEPGCKVSRSIIADNAVIKKGAIVGSDDKDAPITVIADNVVIGENVVIKAGEIVEKDVM